MLNDAYRENLNTILRAAKAGRLALMECQDKHTGKPCAVICAVSDDGDGVLMVPIARIYDDNPYDHLNPPNPDGGFFMEDI